jgi:hypothetical protein
MKSSKKITTDFKKFDVYLSNDIVKDSQELERVPDGYEIEEIIDVITPDTLEENWIGVPDISQKELKRGELIYITALIRKKGTTSFTSPSTQAVLKVRIVDIYQGLSYLNKVINK